MSPFYGPDLAHIHHTGFADFSQRAAPGLLAALRRAGIRSETVVDLGCGGGQWLAALSRAGYDPIGIEISPALAKLARREAPRARVRVGSIYTEALPRCDAVTSLSEVLGYLPAGVRVPSFATFFRRVARSLRPGGLFVFDLILRNPRTPLHTRNYRIDEVDQSWAVLAETTEDPRRHRLTRDITTFRRVGSACGPGATYRRTHEVHHVRVPTRAEILRALATAGFTTRTSRRYGRLPLAPHRLAFFARRH
jgi:SAM-dependent methyltransferase